MLTRIHFPRHHRHATSAAFMVTELRAKVSFIPRREQALERRMPWSTVCKLGHLDVRDARARTVDIDLNQVEETTPPTRANNAESRRRRVIIVAPHFPPSNLAAV